MAIVTVEWLASAKLLKEELTATGKSASPRRSIVIDLEQLEPGLRAAILDLTELTGMLLKSGVGLTPIRLRRVRTFTDGDHPVLSWGDVALDAEPTAAGLPLLAHGIRVELAKAEAKMKEIKEQKAKETAWLNATYQTARGALDLIVGGEAPTPDRLAKLRELDVHALVPEAYPMDFRPPKHMNLYVLQAEEIRLLEKQRRRIEKIAWIGQHGSERLRRCTALGYDCQRLYVKERAALEAPGFTCDFDDAAEWKTRSCPSVVTLNKRVAAVKLGLGAPSVVWLTKPPQQEIPALEGGPFHFEPCEAIVIEGYLGGYALVRGNW